MITIDARELSEGIDYTTFFQDYYAALPQGSSTYHGGEPDEAFGGMYYVSGPQVSFTYGDDSSAMTLLEGHDMAYDFIHYGAEYGHGISGEVDSVIFGWADDGTGTVDGTENGLVEGLDGLLIRGLDLSAEPGEGNVPENFVYWLYRAIQRGYNGDEGEDLVSDLYGIFSQQAQKFIGSAFGDKYIGTDGDDMVRGLSGGDVLAGGLGNDLVNGDGGNDVLYGGGGSDDLFGGNGDDILFGGNGRDELAGEGGDDVLAGGARADRLSGGEGADVFDYDLASDSTTGQFDRILDFESGVDTIDLTDLGDLALVDAFSGSAGEVVVADLGAHGSVEADLDGDGIGDFLIAIRFGDVTDGDLLI